MSASLVMIPSALYPLNATFTFTTINVPEGYPTVSSTVEAETLQTPGVSGTRWREVYKQFRRLTVSTMHGFASFNAAAAEVEKYLQAVHSKGTLTFIANGLTVRFRVHIEACDPIARPGPVAGVASSQASVRCAWSLMRVAF